jgi:hypothetical protein
MWMGVGWFDQDDTQRSGKDESHGGFRHKGETCGRDKKGCLRRQCGGSPVTGVAFGLRFTGTGNSIAVMRMSWHSQSESSQASAKITKLDLCSRLLPSV